VLAAAWVDGLQSRNVGASLKHFAVNSQETDRMRVSADVDERTLREMYSAPSGGSSPRPRPWTVMCAYNKVNGVYAASTAGCSPRVLRDEWGYDGVLVSDWGAVADRVARGRRGPGPDHAGARRRGRQELAEAVADGRLDPALLRRAAGRVSALVEKAAARTPGRLRRGGAPHPGPRDRRRAIVLLRTTPFLETSRACCRSRPTAPGPSPSSASSPAPRATSGGGSSQITPTRLDDALTEITAATEATIVFAPGYLTGDSAEQESAAQDGETEAESDQDLPRRGRVALASVSDVALVFVGSAYETEGADRDGIDLPEAHRS